MDEIFEIWNKTWDANTEEGYGIKKYCYNQNVLIRGGER